MERSSSRRQRVNSHRMTGMENFRQVGMESFRPEAERRSRTGPVTVVLPMESGEEYELLSQFLALSSDQFSVYTVAFIDPVTGTPVQPEEAVEVTLSIPSGYDMSRVVVSEITMNEATPSRTEISYTNENNSAVFKTDHAGLYVVMEKKVQAELPPSLEMTDKVEKLKLTKTLPTSLPYTSASEHIQQIRRQGTMQM